MRRTSLYWKANHDGKTRYGESKRGRGREEEEVAYSNGKGGKGESTNICSWEFVSLSYYSTVTSTPTNRSTPTAGCLCSFLFLLLMFFFLWKKNRKKKEKNLWQFTFNLSSIAFSIALKLLEKKWFFSSFRFICKQSFYFKTITLVKFGSMQHLVWHYLLNEFQKFSKKKTIKIWLGF